MMEDKYKVKLSDKELSDEEYNDIINFLEGELIAKLRIMDKGATMSKQHKDVERIGIRKTSRISDKY